MSPPGRRRQPPPWQPRPNQLASDLTAVRTARGRRDVLAQCQRCGALATARCQGQRQIHTGLPLDEGGRHAGCGGPVSRYDIGLA